MIGGGLGKVDPVAVAGADGVEGGGGFGGFGGGSSGGGGGWGQLVDGQVFLWV